MNTLKLAAPFVGESETLLRNEPIHSQQKVILMALSLLIPVFLWLVQGTLLAHFVMDQPWLIALGVGVGCTLLIYLVDRVILMSSMTNSWLIFARMLLALCIALVGGVSTDLAVYHGDINRKIDRLYARQLDSLDRAFEHTDQKEEQNLVNEVQNKQTTLNEIQKVYLAEIQGRGSRGSGPGTISEAILKNLRKPAQEELSKAQEKLSRFQKNREARKEKNRQQAKRENGLELRINLLHDTVGRSWFSILLFVAFTMGFFLMELFPLLTKLTLRPTALDIKREQEESRQKKIATTLVR